jgi:putative ABC transport system permease protein
VGPLFPLQVTLDNEPVLLVGSEFGNNDSIQSLQKTIPYLSIKGKWPQKSNEIVIGDSLSRKFHWGQGKELNLSYGEKLLPLRVVGTVRSGGAEDQQAFGMLSTVQTIAGHPGEFKQLLVSAVVNPTNELYFRFQKNPRSLSPKEFERYSCTPYLSSVSKDIAKVFTGGEASIVRQVSMTEEKVVKKVNWLMILVTLAALIASSLTMTSTTAALVMQRRKELALMKAIGSNNSFVLRYLFMEILLLGTVGSLLGYALGTFFSSILGGTILETVFTMKPIVLPLVLFVGLLIILLGSLWPLRRAMMLDPAEVLRDL